MQELVSISDCPEDCKDVFSRYVALDIMYGVENEAAVRCEYFNSLTDLVINLIGRAEWKCFLCVNTATPEDNIFSEFFFEGCGVHIRSGTLNGIQDIEAGIYKVRYKLIYGTAGVYESFPVGELVDFVIYHFMERFIEAPVRIR